MDQEPDSGENAETAVQPPQVRGWIVLFVVVTAVSLVRATEGFFVFMSSVESHALPSADVAPAERLYDIVAGVSGGVGAIMIGIGFVMMFLRAATVPKYWRRLLVAIACVDLCWMPVIQAYVGEGRRRLHASEALAVAEQASWSYFTTALGIVICLVWARYWLKSRRVEATYGPQEVSSIWDDPLGALWRTRGSNVAREEAEGGVEMGEE